MYIYLIRVKLLKTRSLIAGLYNGLQIEYAKLFTKKTLALFTCCNISWLGIPK